MASKLKRLEKDAALSREKVDEIVDYITKSRGGHLSVPEMMSLAELMVTSLHSFFDALDTTIYREFKDIAEYISRAKEEISKLQPGDISSYKIPEAGKELDAIVKSTEEATHTIMECAECIMAADPEDIKNYQNVVNDAVIQIFEACSFQDITGQRISKIVETFNYIDARISRFADLIGDQTVEEVLTDDEMKIQERKDKYILHGPQLEGEGVNQDEVDAMLSGVGDSAKDDVSGDSNIDEEDNDKKTSQDDIDALFD